MSDLATLGFGPFFEQQLQPPAAGDGGVARVAAEHRGAYEVWSSSGAGPAQLSGKLRHVAADSELPGVGDWVVVRDEPAADRIAVIDRVLERRTVFTRGAAGRQARAQVIAANVDLVFAVCGLDADFNLHRIERYLARIWASGAQPVLILNKADLADDVTGQVTAVEGHCAGVPILVTSALHAAGIDEVRARIQRGMTVALVGSSGAGKSTLINALLGEERQATGAVRESDGRGRHVTTRRQLVVLPGGGLLLDTPGMRELQLVDDDGLDEVFTDISELAASCRFGDCQHGTEPGCAVRAAVQSGALAADRLEHFQKLAAEARAYEQRHDARLQRQTGRLWGQLHAEVAQLRRWKGGKL